MMISFRRRPVSILTTLVVLLIVFGTLFTTTTEAHESCCKHKLLLQEQQKQQQQWIPDPDDHPPLINKPDDVKPADWDDEDDGEWAPAQIEDPHYERRLILNPNYVPPPTFWDKLQTELEAALPWVTLGVVVTGVLSCLKLSSNFVPKLLMSGSGSNLLLASLLGLATPLCSCGALPLCVGLVQNGGIPLPQVLAFLISSQSAGLDSAAVTYGLLGGTAMVARLLGAIVLACAVGLACPTRANSENKTKSSTTTTTTTTCHAHTTADNTNNDNNNILMTLWDTCVETATEIYPTVFMGLTLSTAALHYLPSLTTYSTSSRLLVLAAALPLQLCEHTSVTLAGAIQKAGGTPGLAFALLLSAPAVNLPTLLFVAQQQGGPLAAIRTATVLLVTALSISWLVDGLQLDLLAAESTGEMATLPNWWIQFSPHLAGTLLVVGYGQKLFLGGEDNTKSTKDTCCGSTTATTTNGCSNGNNGDDDNKAKVE